MRTIRHDVSREGLKRSVNSPESASFSSGVRANGLGKAIARALVSHVSCDNRFGYEIGDSFRDRGQDMPSRVPSWVTSDMSNQREDNRQPPKHRALCLAEQLAAPLQHAVEALMARDCRAKPTRQKIEPIVKALGELAHAEDFRLRRSQLQRERHPVETSADYAANVASRSVSVNPPSVSAIRSTSNSTAGEPSASRAVIYVSNWG